VTTIDATGLGGSVVTCSGGEGPDTILDGFTLTGGTGTLIGTRRYGGGMYNSGSIATVTHCTFRGNAAYAGGGMMNNQSSPTVNDCTFSLNTADYGGGMMNSNSRPTLTYCTFRGNTGSDGGGVFDNFSNPMVAHCTFRGNRAVSGGGMENYVSSPMVSNSTFSGNTASGGGGGIANVGSAPTVTQCTFSGNTAGTGGAIGNRGSNATVTSCIFWRDSPDEIGNEASHPTIRFSDAQGGLPVGAVDGGGNVDLEPMFVRSPDPGPDGTWDGVDDDYGDLRLRAGSSCIDAGDPAFVAQPGETDLEGHARVLCGGVDMGAYEFGIGDYDCDQVVDPADFSSWQACMTNPNATAVSAVPSHEATEPRSHEGAIDIRQSTIRCEGFDFDGDGDVDLLDFGGFQGVFGP
jgi:parallel beta-helix repeat protein